MILVIDEAIKDINLIEEISKSQTLFPDSMGDEVKIASTINSYHVQDSPYRAPYMFWDGWLLSETNTTAKKIIKEIWENNLPFPIEELCGFEYWMRTFKAGQFIDLHLDEDTFLYKLENIKNGSAIGCVYYPHTNEEEDCGTLDIYDDYYIPDHEVDALSKEKMDFYKSDVKSISSIQCSPNRAVIFDAGHVLHKTTPTKQHTKRVMVINVWHKDLQPSGLLTGEFFYE
jgi:hypothetical protein